ncbi:MAG: hypothetical protein MUP58_02010 [Candidatus Nanohaloarchaeota archaeon QJJ-9]|nr:hypothetical protein [Candidatus Nanohaloarchaeota archaeon QJJ-9]
MRKATLLLLVAAFSGLGTAVVGYDGPKDQPHIMGGSSGASQAVGPNGTQWKAWVETKGTDCLSGNLSEIQTNKTENRTEFTGEIQTSNPCYTVRHDVEKVGENTYQFNITTEKSNTTCIDCVGKIRYKAGLETNSSHTVKVYHNGDFAKEIANNPEKPGLFQKLIGWLRNFF